MGQLPIVLKNKLNSDEDTFYIKDALCLVLCIETFYTKDAVPAIIGVPSVNCAEGNLIQLESASINMIDSITLDFWACFSAPFAV